ncbi:MAG: 50S ribosomal protein L11 methyltransferase [Holosporaceae bacterium]|jgi:ribosomal protein L11 methyltransferase|nr:50S ribosomal protein L11 methyltransferase [Holosporaceae bacterium]
MSGTIFKCTVENFDIKEAFEAVDILSELGYQSVLCFQDRGGMWTVEIIRDYRIGREEIRDALSKYNLRSVKTEELDDDNWLQKSLESFKPIFVGPFCIYGPHMRTNVVPVDRIGIEIAAATAFGTGEHSTTRCCLAASSIFFDDKVHRSVLDIGCGTGILAIALAKLGARRVYACDSDPEAVRVSRENTILNGVNKRVQVFQNHDCEFCYGKYDFIVANILSGPLVAMSKAIVSSLTSSGILVLSGFTSHDCSVLQHYASIGFSTRYVYDHDSWTTLVLQKPLI